MRQRPRQLVTQTYVTRQSVTQSYVTKQSVTQSYVTKHSVTQSYVTRQRLVCNRHPPWHVVPTHFSPFHLSQFFEGYGQTETTSVISHSVDIDMTSGHVGVPGGDMEVKLIDVPDLDYHAKDDQGEVKDFSFNH